ncbi:CDP-diacylglycerol--glycerol-3-phosphate 3-phosphatidyltransferase PgsA [Gottschalkia acidurici 9a]|uniref:CDP-diacylglycerol--glycerol-3-phosphate 3-phosphatidyltransferase n=1 Tax=Gottschalkia acidurici (strain ATCC 7906 / DSM 604 / BCRC 14475 / CIP 104303 / KCTC 5404 / NCIMB 10678 / 9a) TaxID=1128398 RepID=K0AZX2_GOTA9|nr:CDP-diacylglycerol--glycerol-3-phosphate 3-phosphatidyltransferase [Gottschalkia acidurici]AFS77891.1 CDP-diacylglycerol--glycerol-3-phosphate 3-phosphatidyltransferase PgsA [Gottschalkia acidurici 9a]
MTNLPNLITTMRFFLIPAFVVMFFSSVENSLMYSTLIFAIAGVTDVIDGYIARTYNMVTKLGIVLDPLADKLMQLTVLICFTIKDYIPMWVIVVIGIKEVLMIFGGIFLYYFGDKTVIPANKFGKIATISFYVAIFIVATNISSILSLVLISLTVVLTIIAFINYFMDFTQAHKDLKK